MPFAAHADAGCIATPRRTSFASALGPQLLGDQRRKAGLPITVGLVRKRNAALQTLLSEYPSLASTR
jgi:hypothetical protein